MKTYKNLIYILFLVALPVLAKAQKSDKSIATCEFTVQGVCEMCKERIEEAALIKGVKMAEWDNSTGVFKAVYREDKVTEKEIHEAIAMAGHATEQVPADSEAYDRLPKCCAYNDGIDKH
ncbi:MAG: cation transporter [Reichenbachiella sp.]|uniref:heavy-metal-associated domain-containing protein n=1 Tax=Reichenbachiella sp. TaxID=2184521 RepID=UPI002966415E|nr:cation transporter [Reichenbachiella sp.]MDW3208847.1 cation transporter [Reichenbachiella sp.]